LSELHLGARRIDFGGWNQPGRAVGCRERRRIGRLNDDFQVGLGGLLIVEGARAGARRRGSERNLTKFDEVSGRE